LWEIGNKIEVAFTWKFHDTYGYIESQKARIGI